MITAHFPPFDTLTTCSTCMGFACEDCCHTGTTVVDQQQKLDTPERDVSQGCDRGGAMGITAGNRITTLTEALRGEIRAAISNACYDSLSEGQTMEVAADRAAEAVWHRICRARGLRLVGPDDVTVTVERLAEALHEAGIRCWKAESGEPVPHDDIHADDARAILAALPPGWRLCGPDDVTATVDGLATALAGVVYEPVVGVTRLMTVPEAAAAILAAQSADKEGQK